MEVIGMGLQAIGKAIGAWATAYAFIYIAGEFSPTLVAIAGQYQTAEDMDNNLALTTIYGRHGQVKVTLQGRSLNYTPLHNY